jgi:hypothetical protein
MVKLSNSKWNDDDSGDEMDVRKSIARRNAKKWKGTSYETQSSIRVDADISTQSISENFEFGGVVAPGNDDPLPSGCGQCQQKHELQIIGAAGS